VREQFEGFLDADPDYSAGMAAYIDGESVVDLSGGPHLQGDSVLTVFSSTKGAIGICIALLVERGSLDLDAPVTDYWPEFGAAGKSDVSVRMLLSHQAGLIGVDGGFGLDELLEHDPLAGRLAMQRPFWRPGSGHGYHAWTLGVLADELVRRITGDPMAVLYADEVRLPRDIDFFVGLPEDQDDRVVDVLQAVPPDGQQDLMKQFLARMHPGTFAGIALNMAAAERGFPDLVTLANLRALQRVGPPAFGGVGSARGLARMYACCISDVGGRRLLSEDTVRIVTQLQTIGTDLVIAIPNRFAVVFQNADDRLSYGSYRAFGHDGGGGSLGFADPEYGLAFGYVTARIPFPGGVDAKALALAATVRDCMGGMAG
jgi:CubicO group peptidase (beta-lactamase class C family)